MTPYLFEEAPRLTRSQAKAQSSLLGVSFSLPTDVLAPFVREELSLRVISVGTGAAPVFAASFLWMHRLTQQRVRLFLDAGFALSVIEAALGGAGASTPRPLSDAERGVLSALLLSVAERVGAPVLLLEETSEPVSGASVLLEVTVGARRGAALLILPLGVIEPKREVRAPLWTLLAPKVARLIIGRASLTREEFSSLFVSDTIIPDELTCDEHGDGIGIVRVDGLTQAVRLKGWRGATQGAWMEERQTPNTAIELSIELGRVSVRVQDLSQWQPGSIVPIGHAPGDPVHLVSEGKVVAHGEIVRIDNELGVRLTWVEK